MERNTNKNQALKKNLLNSWDQMKDRHPIVVNASTVKGDKIKEDFLTYVDGYKSADDIRAFFTLDTSEAHLIFFDLLNMGALRFLTDLERLNYLQAQNLELKKNLDFLHFEKDKLIGEKIYLAKQIPEKEGSINSLRERTGKLQNTLKDVKDKFEDLKSGSSQLWESNSELMALSKDMQQKEGEINEAMIKLEREFKKTIKRKSNVMKKLQHTDEHVNNSQDNNVKLEKKLYVYKDVIDEMNDYLEDARFRIETLMKND